MADTVTIIMPWPLFTAFRDGHALAGAKLSTYVPSTSTPKASFADPLFYVPNVNPVVLDEHGEATVYLNGNYDLRLYDSTDVLVWSVDNYTFSSGVTPQAGTITTGSSTATVTAVDGTAQFTVNTLLPLGYRLLGVTSRITTAWGTSHGLTGIALGDATALDSWGLYTALTVGQVTGQQQMRRGDMPIADVPYTLLVTMIDGPCDGTGGLHLTSTWQAIAPDA